MRICPPEGGQVCEYMSGSYKAAIGVCIVLLLLVFASLGVEATTVHVGNLAVSDQFSGANPPWIQIFQYFNGSNYNGPYQNFWSAGSILYFNLSMKVKNVNQQTTDFKWTVKVNQEENDNYDIYIESDPKVHNQDANHWVYGILQNGDFTISGHIEITPQNYWDNIDIITVCTPYRNGQQVGAMKNTQWSWVGTP